MTTLADNAAQYMALDQENKRLFVETFRAVIANNIPALERIKTLVPDSAKPIVDQLIAQCTKEQETAS